MPLGRPSPGKYKFPVKGQPYSPLPSPWCLILHIKHWIFNKHWEDISFLSRTKRNPSFFTENQHTWCDTSKSTTGPGLPQWPPGPHSANHVKHEDPSLYPHEKISFLPASQQSSKQPSCSQAHLLACSLYSKGQSVSFLV